MDKPILILDLDDVLNNLVDVWLDVYNKKYNDNLLIEDIKGWDIGSYTKVGKEMYTILEDQGLFESLDIQPDCFEVLKWASEKFDIQIASASNPKTVLQKANWIQKHLSFIPLTSFSSVYSKYILKGEIIIDDKPENIEKFDGQKLLFSKPWNRDREGDFIRVENWKEIELFLRDYLLRKELDWNNKKPMPKNLSEFIRKISRERVQKIS